jgi:hypothetical protein
VPATVNGGDPAIGPIAEVVVVTHRIADDVAACARIFGWDAGAEQAVSVRSAARWGAPAAAGARVIAVRPPVGAPGGGVRFVAAEAPHEVSAPLRTLGWAAFEMAVADVDAIAEEVAAADLAVLGRPAAVGATQLDGGHRRPALRAMQVALPGGAPVYLTEVNRDPDGFRLPRVDTGTGGVFIVVVASPDLDVTRGFLESRFGLTRVTDHRLAVGVLNRAYALPPTSTHRVSSVHLAGEAAIEIDQYPPAASPRPLSASGLPDGIAVVEFLATRRDVQGGPVHGPFGLRLAIRARR